MKIQELIWPIVYGVVAGLGYALLFFARAAQASSEGFDLKKFVRALLIGGFIGGVTAWFGVPLTELNYQTQIQAYGFVTMIVDQLLKMLWKARKA